LSRILHFVHLNTDKLKRRNVKHTSAPQPTCHVPNPKVRTDRNLAKKICLFI